MASKVRRVNVLPEIARFRIPVTLDGLHRHSILDDIARYQYQDSGLKDILEPWNADVVDPSNSPIQSGSELFADELGYDFSGFGVDDEVYDTLCLLVGLNLQLMKNKGTQPLRELLEAAVHLAFDIGPDALSPHEVFKHGTFRDNLCLLTSMIPIEYFRMPRKNILEQIFVGAVHFFWVYLNHGPSRWRKYMIPRAAQSKQSPPNPTTANPDLDKTQAELATTGQSSSLPPRPQEATPQKAKKRKRRGSHFPSTSKDSHEKPAEKYKRNKKNKKNKKSKKNKTTIGAQKAASLPADAATQEIFKDADRQGQLAINGQTAKVPVPNADTSTRSRLSHKQSLSLQYVTRGLHTGVPASVPTHSVASSTASKPALISAKKILGNPTVIRVSSDDSSDENSGGKVARRRAKPQLAPKLYPAQLPKPRNTVTKSKGKQVEKRVMRDEVLATLLEKEKQSTADLCTQITVLNRKLEEERAKNKPLRQLLGVKGVTEPGLEEMVTRVGLGSTPVNAYYAVTARLKRKEV